MTVDFPKNKRYSQTFRACVCAVLAVFVLNTVAPVYAQGLSLPVPGTMIAASTAYSPVIAAGIMVYPQRPLKLDFIISTGDDNIQGYAFKEESQKLINYFLAVLTVPDDEMWVNLSPHEPDRIIANGLGQTEMGRDMLAQDYLLKQLTASLIYPENELGQKFWNKVYEESFARFGVTEVPKDMFNKVWIVPERAVVYVNPHSPKGQKNVFVSESRLKVMLEEDYLAEKTGNREQKAKADILLSEVMRKVIIPAIETEVNEGKNFANLRQIYHSMILALWYKDNLKKSVLGKAYMDTNKVAGIDLKDKHVKEKVYDQYLKAFQKGVCNYIKEEYDPNTKSIVPRKYLSGGIVKPEQVLVNTVKPSDSAIISQANRGEVKLQNVQTDLALMGKNKNLSNNNSPQLNNEKRLWSLKEIGFNLKYLPNAIPLNRYDVLIEKYNKLPIGVTEQGLTQEDVDFLRLYGKIFSEEYYQKGTISGYQNYTWKPEIAFSRVNALIENGNIKKTDLILDYGSALGFYVKAFRQKGYQAWGIDISSYAINQEKSELRKFLMYFEEKNTLEKLKKLKFDFIIIKDVLEHVPLKILPRLLITLSKIGEKAFIMVPFTNQRRSFISIEDEKDLTHVIRKNKKWWIKLLGEKYRLDNATNLALKGKNKSKGTLSAYVILDESFRRAILDKNWLEEIKENRQVISNYNKVFDSSDSAIISRANRGEVKLQNVQTDLALVSEKTDNIEFLKYIEMLRSKQIIFEPGKSGSQIAQEMGFGGEFQKLYNKLYFQVITESAVGNLKEYGQIIRWAEALAGVEPKPFDIYIASSDMIDKSNAEEFWDFDWYLESFQRNKVSLNLSVPGNKVANELGFGDKFAELYDQFVIRIKEEMHPRKGIRTSRLKELAREVRKEAIDKISSDFKAPKRVIKTITTFTEFIKSAVSAEQIDKLLGKYEEFLRVEMQKADQEKAVLIQTAKAIKEINDVLIPKGFLVEARFSEIAEERMLVLYEIDEVFEEGTSEGSVTTYFVNQITQFSDGSLKGHAGWSSDFNDYVVVFRQLIKEDEDDKLSFVLSGGELRHKEKPKLKRDRRRAKKMYKIVGNLIRKSMSGKTEKERLAIEEEIIRLHETEHEIRRRIRDIQEGDFNYHNLEEEIVEVKSMIGSQEPLYALTRIIRLAIADKIFAWSILSRLSGKADKADVILWLEQFVKDGADGVWLRKQARRIFPDIEKEWRKAYDMALVGEEEKGSVSAAVNVAYDRNGRIAILTDENNNQVFKAAYSKEGIIQSFSVSPDLFVGKNNVFFTTSNNEIIGVFKDVSAPYSVAQIDADGVFYLSHFNHQKEAIVLMDDKERLQTAEFQLSLNNNFMGAFFKMNNRFYDIANIYILKQFISQIKSVDLKNKIQEIITGMEYKNFPGSITDKGRMKINFDILFLRENFSGKREISILDTAANDGITGLDLFDAMNELKITGEVTTSDLDTDLFIVNDGENSAVFGSRGNIWQITTPSQTYSHNTIPESYDVSGLRAKFDNKDFISFNRLHWKVSEALKTNPNFKQRELDVFDVDLPKNEYDFIRNFNLTQYLTNDQIVKMLANLGKSLKEGGLIVVGKGGLANIDYGIWQRQGNILKRIIKNPYATETLYLSQNNDNLSLVQERKAVLDIDLTTGKRVDQAMIGNKTDEKYVGIDFAQTVNPEARGINSFPDDPVGGIDFNADNVPLETTGGEVDFAVPEQWKDVDLNSIRGVAPVIINIVPVTNIPQLIGLAGQEAPSHKS